MKKTTLSGSSLPKRDLRNQIIASLLLIFFVHTLISSYIQLQSLKNLLAFYTRNTGAVAWSIIITEAIAATLIFFPRTRLIGFIAAFLIVAFAGITILRYPHYPHDFGGVFNNISRTQKWFLITLTVILSLAGIISNLIKRSNRVIIKDEEAAVVT